MTNFTINLAQKKYPILRNNNIFFGDGLVDSFSAQNGRVFINKTVKKIENVAPALGIVFSTPTHKFITCSSPEVDTNDKLSKDYFARQINEVREASGCKDEEVSGVIYGGLAYDINNPLSENSCNMVDTFEAACQAEGVKPTIITGRNSADLGNFSAYIGEEQLTLWGDLINKIDLTKKASEKQIIKFLERLFEYVKIPENTAVKIIDDYNGTTKYLSKLEEK